MNRGELETEVRRKGRFNKAVAKALIDANLNEAAKQFSRDTHIILKTVSIVIEEKFSLTTSEAFNLTISTAGSGYITNAVDVVLATAQSDVTGATLASALQAIIQSTASGCAGATATTIVYSQTTRKFTIEASAETSSASVITIAPPAAPGTYYDAAHKLFGVTVSDSATGGSYVGAVAPFAQSEVKLPSDFLEFEEVIYKDEYWKPLQPEIYRGRSDGDGDPDSFSVVSRASGQYLRFTDQPLTIDTRVELTYAYKPAAIVTGTATDSSSYPFDSNYDMALVFYAIYLTKLGGTPEEMQAALTFKALYNEAKDQAEIDMFARQGGGFDMMARGRQGL